MNQVRDRLEGCHRHGWPSCRLRPVDVRLLLADLPVWTEHGLPRTAAARARAAAEGGRGMRLSYFEITAITLPSPDLLREDGEWERCPHCGGSGWSLA